MKKKKLIELLIDEDKLKNSGVDAISLVEFPAIEEDFIAFNRENNYTFARLDEEKRMITGPAMVPNKQIYRYDKKTNEEYYVFFTPETVEKCAHHYVRDQKAHNTTFEHKSNVDSVYLVESWIIRQKNDAAYEMGYDVPKGTWMVTMKVDNDEVWNNIKNGKVRGYSIEGYFTDMLVEYAKIEKDPDTVYLMWDMNNTENPCPACQKLHGFIMKEEEWKGLGPREASNTGRYSTFCEEDCRCELVRAEKGFYDPRKAAKMVAYLREVREINLMSDKKISEQQFTFMAEKLAWIMEQEKH